MKVDHRGLRRYFDTVQEGKRSPHTADARLAPSVFQYDWLLLHLLSEDVAAMLREHVTRTPAGVMQREAVDVGSFRSPYRSLLTSHGFRLRTLDITSEHGADLVGSAEQTLLESGSVDLLLCTQVLEHTRQPWVAMQEFFRVVAPGGAILITIPHVWFYHPHPGDYWRVTQEGMIALCEDAGFEVADLRVQGGVVAAVAQIFNFSLYGVVGRFGAPAYVLVNLIGVFIDRLLPNQLFSLNIGCLAAKRA